MAKKQMTVAQKQKTYRALQYTFTGCSFISVLMPFIILGAVHFDEWFRNENGWKIGLGGTLAMAVVGFAFVIVTFKKEKEWKVTDGWITFIIIFLALTLAVLCIKDILDQLVTIMFCALIGLCAAFGFDMTSKSMKVKADEYLETINEVKKDNLKEKVEKETKLEKEEPTE